MKEVEAYDGVPDGLPAKRRHRTYKSPIAAFAAAAVSEASPAYTCARDPYLLRTFGDLVGPAGVVLACGHGYGHDPPSASDSSRTTDVLDTATGKWHGGPNLLVPRYMHGAAHVGGCVFLFGGITRETNERTRSVEMLEIGADAWKEMPSMPHDRTCPCVSAVGPRIYIFGGYSIGGGQFLSYDTFDTSATSWTDTATVPWLPGVEVNGTAAVGHRIYAFCAALHVPVAIATCFVLDTTTGEWTEFGCGRRRCQSDATLAVSDDRFIWIVQAPPRGAGTGIISCLDTERCAWLEPDIVWERPRGHAQAAVVGHRLFLLGGYLRDAPCNTVEVLDLKTKAWLAGAADPMPRPRVHHACVGL